MFKGVPYAPLELYLMGLVPVTDLPATFPLLEDASVVDLDPRADTALIEASGLGAIETSAIVARHGERAPTPEAERHFTAAFVVVTSAPANLAFLDRVVEWQETFGGHAPDDGLVSSFAEHTGGRATLTTRIGRRRTSSDPAPPSAAPVCDPFAQDCASPLLGCYDFEAPECLPSGGLPAGASCEFTNDCAPGSECGSFGSAPSTCVRYCDPNDDASPRACSALCPGAYVEVRGSDQTLVGAYCSP